MMHFGNVCLRVIGAERFSLRRTGHRACHFSSRSMQRPSLSWFATLGLAMLAVALATRSALSQDHPPLVPVGSAESRLLADAADGTLDHQSLLRAALIAGGEEDHGKLNLWQDRFEALCAPLEQRHAQGETLQAETLFGFLHSQILTGDYVAAVTTVPTTLQTGDYNCLTATTLLIALGDRYSVPLEAVSTSGHIYCRYVGESPFEIETTNPDWSKARSTSVNRYAAARGINRVQVVAKIYYNRGLEQLAQKKFAAAIPILQRSLQLDPEDADARENLLAGMNNWALFLADGERFAEAAERIRAGQLIDANYQPFVANQLHIYQRWAAWHCARHEYQAALATLEAGRNCQPDAPLFLAGPKMVYAQWLDWHLKRGELPQAEEVLASALPQLEAANARLQPSVQLPIKRLTPSPSE